MCVFDSTVQHLVLFRPVKAHIMMLGESRPTGIGRVQYFYLTQTPSSSRGHMDDAALLWTTQVLLAHGWRHFEEMLMPGKIDLRAMRRLGEQRLQPPPQIRLDTWIVVSRPWGPELYSG